MAEIDISIGATVQAYSTCTVEVPDEMMNTKSEDEIKEFICAEVKKKLRTQTFEAAWDGLDEFRIVDAKQGDDLLFESEEL